MRRSTILPVLVLLLAATPIAHGQFFDLPPQPPPHAFGNLLIDRLSTANGVEPVLFSHWSHRVRYTCRVCHLELDFAFEVNGTEITEQESRDGMYCGACHDGEVAFDHGEENCDRCHTRYASGGRQRFSELRKRLPPAGFGNQIDWTLAMARGDISPLHSIIDPDEKLLEYDAVLELAAEWNFVPPAIFSHRTHVPWLDCANCHPDIFNVKKKTTEHFEMRYILERKFCGVCHFTVALPLNDCRTCHPGMETGF